MASTIEWIGYSLLAVFGLLFLAGIFFGVLFPKAAGETRKGIAGEIDKVIGKETLKAGEVFVEPYHLEVVDYLKRTIEKMRDSSVNECYLSYQYGAGSDKGKNGFPTLDEKGTSIILEAVPQGMKIYVVGGAEGLQEHSIKTIEGVSPCVISGGSVPQNFYNKFVTKQETGPYQTSVNKIQIKYDSSGFNENRIAYDKQKFLDFEDGGLLFKAGKNICLFPTVDFSWPADCDGNSADGLDDDCLGVEKNIISLSNGRLKECGTGLTPPRLVS